MEGQSRLSQARGGLVLGVSAPPGGHSPLAGKNRACGPTTLHSGNLLSRPSPASYSIMEGSLVSKIWSVRIHGMDISIGNWIRRPMVNSRKNSRNQSWDRSQHCCRASESIREEPRVTQTKHHNIFVLTVFINLLLLLLFLSLS